MSMRAFPRSFFGAKRSRTITRKCGRYRPMIEMLEDRLAPAVFTVNSTLDTDDLLALNATTTLRKAIRLANVDAVADTINFAAALTNQTITLGGTQLPTISQPITITGLGSGKLTIDANNSSRIFNIDDSSDTTTMAVSISGLRLTRGKADDGTTADTNGNRGGAIFSKEELTLADCLLDHNVATTQGGGIFNERLLRVTNSTLSDNSATLGFGGGISSGTSLILTNSTLTRNRAANSSGGGIRGVGNMTVTNSTFFDNSASSGGGITNGSNGSILTVSDSTLVANRALDGGLGGGGILNSNFCTLTVTNSTLSANSAAGAGGGGGIRNFGTLTLMNSTVFGNHAAAGGGIYNLGGSVTVTNSTLSSNSAGAGGGICIASGTVNVTNSTVSGNSVANGDGGGIWNAGTLTVTNSTLSGNSASDDGGGIHQEFALTVTNSTIVANRADSAGGGFGGGSGGGISNSGVATIFNTIVAGNVKGTGVGSADDIAGANLGGASAFNLIGDPNSSGGLTNVNGNIVGKSDGVLFRLLPLAEVLDPTLRNNGGPTLTHALLPGSFAIDAGNFSAANTTSEVQAIHTAVSGSFTLTFMGQITGALSVTATALEVQTALNALTTIGGVGGRVAVTFVAIDEEYIVAFGGNLVNTDVPQMIAAGRASVTTRTDGHAGAGISEVQTVALSGAVGTFMLGFNGQSTAALSNTATAAQVQTALIALATIGGIGGSVAVTKTGNTFTVTFSGTLANANVSQLGAGGSPAPNPVVTTTTDGNVGLSTFEVQTVTAPAELVGGDFTLTFNGQTTGGLNGASSTAAQVQAALIALSTIGGVGGSVAVTQTQVVTGQPVTFTVKFGGALANTDVPQMTAVSDLTFTSQPTVVATTTNGIDFGPTTDQRGAGFPRVVGVKMDIGAYEMPRALFTDDFDRGNSSTLGAPWQTPFGAFRIAGNLAQGTTANTNIAALASFAGADVDLYADVNLATGTQSGLIARFTNASNYYAATVTREATGLITARLVKVVGGVYTELAVAEETVAIGKLRLRVVGRTLQMSFNGSLLATATDPSLAAGSVGMRTFGNSALDNFQAWPITTGVDNFDSFKQADNITLGDPWVQNQGFYRTVGNRIQGGQALNLATINAGLQADVDVRVAVGITGIGHHASLLARYRSVTDSGYQATLVRTATGFNAYLFLRTNGVYTQLATTTIVSVSGNAGMRFLVTGSNLKVFVNNILVFDQLNTALTVGTVGIRSDNYGFFDDFSAMSVRTDLPVADDFALADSSSLNSRWTRGAGDFVVVAGKAMAKSPTTLSVVTLAGVQQANVEVQADIAIATVGNHASLLACYNGVGDANYYMGLVQKTSAGFSLSIVRNTGGSLTLLATAGVASLTGKIKFRVQGSSLTLFMNGVLQLTATDGALTSGSVGFRSFGAGTIDNFTATALSVLPFTEGFPSTGAGLSASWLTRAGGYTTSAAGAVDKAKGTAGLNFATLRRLSVADVDMQAKINVANSIGSFANLTARVSSAAAPDFYFATIYWTGLQFNAEIYKQVNGVITLLGSTTVGSGAGVLRFTAIGGRLELYFGGVKKLSVFDLSLKTGSVGIRSSLSTTLDDFSAAQVN